VPKENRKPRKRKSTAAKKVAEKAKEEAKVEVVQAAKSLLAVAPSRPKDFKISAEKPKKAAKPPQKRKKREPANKEEVKKKKKVGRPPKKAQPETPAAVEYEESPKETAAMSDSEMDTPDLGRFRTNVSKKKISKTSKKLEGLYDMGDLPTKKGGDGLNTTIVEQLSRSVGESSVLKDLLEQYNEMKMKYQELKSSRMSHVQSMLEEQSKNILKQQEASDKLIKHWKQEAYKQADMVNLAVEESVKEAHEKLVYLGNKKAQLEQLTSELESEVNKLKEENTTLRSESSLSGSGGSDSFFLVPLLTGLEVIVHSHKKEVYRVSHTRTGFSFELDCSKLSDPTADTSDIGYTPVSFGTLDSKLPEYLKEEIYFDKSQVPILLEKILSTVKVSN